MLARVSDALRENLRAMGVRKMTKIQEQAFEPILAGRNFQGISETGSGKTIAYLLPTLQRLENEKFPGPAAALILVPTRELARQVGAAAVSLSPGVDVALFYGGSEGAAGAAVYVATPVRAWEMIQSGVSFARLKILILDEADFLMSGAQRPRVTELLAALRRQAGEPQTLFFSASAADAAAQPARLTHAILKVGEDPAVRLAALALLLETKTQALVFASSAAEADTISKYLEISSGVMHSGLAQSQRDFTVTQFRDKKIRILIATDLAARGLDFPGLPCVVNFRPPREFRNYMHRAGRTARAGAAGESIVLANPAEAAAVAGWARFADFQKLAPATAPDLQAARMQKLKEEISSVSEEDVNIFRKNCEEENTLSLLAKILSRLDSGFAGERKNVTVLVSGVPTSFEASLAVGEALGLEKLQVEPAAGGFLVSLDSVQAKLLLGGDVREKLAGKGVQLSVSNQACDARRRLKRLPWERKVS